MLIEELAPGVVLVGTAHVSPTSVAEVERVIRERRPAKVLVELDPRRLQALQDADAWRRTDIVQVIKEGKQHLFLLQLYLAAMQARMGRETGVTPGAELVKAITTAQEVGAEVVLMDRDVGMTLRRAFDGLGLQQKAGLALNVLLEMLPSSPPEERKRPSLGAALALPLAVVAALLLSARLTERVAGGAGRILDGLIGYASAPAVTVAVLGGILGAVAAWMAPLRAPRHAPTLAERLGGGAWAGVFLGLLAVWAWGFADGLSPAFLARMLPGPTSAGLGGLAALAWAALGAVLAFRFTRLVRRVLAQRDELTRPGALDVEALLQKDAITQMTEEFARFAPGIKRVLIDERDAYMASHIAEQAQALAPPPAATAGWESGPVPGAQGGIVAVVGAGHMAGIRQRLAAARPSDRAPLEAPPAARLTVGKVLAWAVPLALVGVFGYLGYRGWQDGNFGDLLASLGWFALITATCSAAGAAIALGHPWSILAAFLAAPIATLHPLIASGWFAGIVEAKVRTPKVSDFEAIKTLQTMGEFWRNGVVRILLVTAITNLGAMVGFWIATSKVLQILGGGA